MSPLLQRLRLNPLDATLGGSSPTTNWGRLAAGVAAYNAAVSDRRSIIVRRELLDDIERLLRAGKGLEIGFRGLRHRDSRQSKRTAAQQLSAEIAVERAALATETQNLKNKFDGIQDEIWRQYIDLRRQGFGSAVFDRGLHGKPPEAGYLASMAAAHKFAHGLIGQRMTADLYEQLQQLTRAHSDDEAMAGWSSHTDHVNADRSTAGTQFEADIRKAWEPNDVDEAYRLAQEMGLPMGDTFTMIPHPATINFSFHYKDKGEAASKARIDRLFEDYYRQLHETDEPLRAISALHKNLEYLHAFKDANTRTNNIVLNKLLVECGFNPVVLDDPNQSYTQTIGEWETLLKRGMKRWRAIGRAQLLGADVEQLMQDFDLYVHTPDRNKLQDREDSAEDLSGLQAVDFRT
ncbi:MAG: Fic family protein [Solirubrobacteraceae bacterium]|nr:Fic family protein [Solirubrobacteraceae bacterium]